MLEKEFPLGEEDVYDEKMLDELAESDEISAEEEGFMLGYLGE